jgi:hypothetical protein
MEFVMNEKIRTDILITLKDVDQVRTDVQSGCWKTAVYDLLGREPELAVAVSRRFQHIQRVLSRFEIPAKDWQYITHQMSLLAWVPAVLIDRAHRRLWDGFLPSEETAEREPRDCGGGK